MFARTALVILCVACASIIAPPTRARANERLLHTFSAVVPSPDGLRVAAIESDEPAIDGQKTHSALTIRSSAGGPPIRVGLACGDDVDCVPSEPVWSPDSATLAFVLRSPKATARSIQRVDADGANTRTLLTFTGTLVDLRYSPQGRLAVLATPGARKEVGATQAAAPLVGEIGGRIDEQRIATVQNGALHFVSPAGLYVYEYDWLPNGRGFVGTAAPGDGDNNWWIAKIYAFANGSSRVVYAPASPRQQIASPRVAPDGRTIGFIGGIMSDFGSTGGDVFVAPFEGGAARNLTAGAPRSVTAIAWSRRRSGDLYATWLQGPGSGVSVFRTVRSSIVNGAVERVLAVDERALSSGAAAFRVANTDASAGIVQDFTHPPELAFGPSPGAWHAITQSNAGIAPAARARSIAWTNDGFHISGWLLEPLAPLPKAKRAMITLVHGGPSAAYRPQFIARGTVRALLRDGYAVFEPNPRGSYGAGETFTLANVRDFGYGDLRDILTGIDAVERVAPIDDRRLGITGYSYGGYLTMWTVTQTKRFAAAVAGAGISDWLSYYGENGIDRWMIPFFGASVYTDPAIYARSAPITFITHVTTPTFEYVGDRDVECPAPQTQEFWHALSSLGVPTSFVVYAGQGHGLRDPKDRADAQRRTLAWFDRYLRR